MRSDRSESEEKYHITGMIHRLLDGDLSPDEKQALMSQVRADPALKEEFDALTAALSAVETSERLPAPPFFTSEVLRRLQPGKASIGNRAKIFFLKERVLRWNMATAVAAAAFFVLIQVVRIPNIPVEVVAVSHQEQAVTVIMELEAPQANHVAVAGTFNKWEADASVLTKQANGIWTISIPLKPGEYKYMFVVDGKAWVTDPNAESYSDDGFGNKNAVVRVKT